MFKKIISLFFVVLFVFSATFSVFADENEKNETIVFGNYHAPIEWDIIAEDDDSYTLLSKNILGKQIFHNYWAHVSWDNCDLRKWVNNDFVSEAFSEEEKSRLLETEIVPGINPDFPDTPQGETTYDKVWFLSYEEWENLPKELQNATPTKWAQNHGALCNIYWLRTNGNRQAYAVVIRNGDLWSHGYYVIGSRRTIPITGFRPVIRISK